MNYKYNDEEKRINSVLAYQDKELRELQDVKTPDIELQISESEDLLRSLGYEMPQAKGEVAVLAADTRKVMVVPSWDELCEEAEKAVGNECVLESLFTEDELNENREEIRQLHKEFESLYKLDKFDVGISAAAAILGAAVDILLVGIPQKGPEGLEAGPLSDYIRKAFDKKFPPEEMEKLASSTVSKVTYDAQDNRNTIKYVEGLSAYYHRLLSLGHDPLIGLVVGVADIMRGGMTTIDKKGQIVFQVMENYADRKETNIFSALTKQVLHFKSDVTTSMGLPAPLMGLFNLLQFGSIGEEEQTIAEIVQGMYYEGYDFIHFCSLSIPVMITEVVVRIGYALKRIKEGHSIKESIPFSTNRDKNPKLATMLFVAHSGATAVNAGKVYFTKNPMAINYPQWMAFAKYSYKQLKWVLKEKPELKDAYINGVLYTDYMKTIEAADNTFDEFSKDYIVVMNAG